MKVLKTILAITIILTDFTFLSGQKLSGLAYSHAIINAIKSGDKNYQKSAIDSIYFDTEFFDDFSDYYYSVFPRNDHWADRYAYINSSYPDSMISLGVATLDAFDEKGYPYYSVNQKVAPSDTLTSQPIKFLHTITGKMFFSFFFQAGGKGDPPEGLINDDPETEGKDTLFVDFLDVSDISWHKVYFTLDNTDRHLFKQVVLEVDPLYLKDGFRFRFRNYTSLPSDYQEGQDLGMFSNADQWHIDYIQMKEAADAAEMNTLKDITIVKPLLSSLTEYTSVPWRHFTLAQSSQDGMRMNIPFSVRNFINDTVFFHRIYKTYNLTSGELLRDRDFERFLLANEYYTYLDDFTTGFNYNDDDTIGKLEIVGFIQPNDISQPLVNDTVKRREVYYDQYAYDDGSAEFGIGIGGEFEENARIAQRYRIFRRSNNPDSLRAVLIYFCKSVDSITADYTYSISIRKNDSISPGSEVLYTSDILSPDYSMSLNEFTRIEIDPPIVISDTFFIVVNQLDGYLNIGYDINNENRNKIFVYSNQTWTNPTSLTQGSLMIRPSFGNYSLPTNIKHNTAVAKKLLIYPNPASDLLYLELPEEQYGNYSIRIYNSVGILQLHTTNREASIPVSSLYPGVYFIVITSKDGMLRQTAKFIKE